MSHASPLPLPTLAEIDARLDALEHERAELRDLRKVVARRESRVAPMAEAPAVTVQDSDAHGFQSPVTNGPAPGPAGIIRKDKVGKDAEAKA